ncbi:MAG: PEP-CTERM sorting domain-containing protein [Kiritimatiellales bacterium]
MKKGISAIVLLMAAVSSKAATVEIYHDWAFTNVVSEANETTAGWYFSGGSGLSDQQINGVNFSGVTVTKDADSSGSSGILSWSSAAGYEFADSYSSFDWHEPYSSQTAMSVGGLWSYGDGTMSLDLDIAAGVDYVISVVTLMPSGSETDRTYDVYVDGALVADDVATVGSDPFNTCVKIYGTSDGNVDLDFSSGGYGDTAPAFSVITVTQIPEPASIAMLCIIMSVGFFIRRRFID